ncbi:hypothetical protein F8388_023396, partial [Cannabis sativa]
MGMNDGGNSDRRWGLVVGVAIGRWGSRICVAHSQTM